PRERDDHRWRQRRDGRLGGQGPPAGDDQRRDPARAAVRLQVRPAPPATYLDAGTARPTGRERRQHRLDLTGLRRIQEMAEAGAWVLAAGRAPLEPGGAAGDAITSVRRASSTRSRSSRSAILAVIPIATALGSKAGRPARRSMLRIALASHSKFS